MCNLVFRGNLRNLLPIEERQALEKHKQDENLGVAGPKIEFRTNLVSRLYSNLHTLLVDMDDLDILFFMVDRNLIKEEQANGKIKLC